MKRCTIPSVIDNVEVRLIYELSKIIGIAKSLSVCVGFLNLKGWHLLGSLIDALL